ncbi:MAG TPA: glycoside hydrolase family 15 protein [Acidimicrobiia bacterium]
MLPIEDYGVIADTQTAALVGRNGSIDWMCAPRFDSPAFFAALLGDEENGHWQIAPAGEVRSVSRRYRGDTLVLETEFTTDEGVVRVVDCMPPRQSDLDVIRIVEGVRGRVSMQTELVVRFGYGRSVPWVRRVDGLWSAVAGPDALVLYTPVELHGENFRTTADFTIGEGEHVPFVMQWHPSHEPARPRLDATTALEETVAWWQDWADRCEYQGDWREAVMRSLLTLKALTYEPTGGIVAAVTTSLPEDLGGVRNWDYRYCWLRDATFTLYALLLAGYRDEAEAWRDWLLRAVAGRPAEMHIMYGAAGERLLPELSLDWLPGYEGSRPVRIGNAAVEQHQLDVYGETMDALHQARRAGVPADPSAWEVQKALMDFLEGSWREPDEGIWEVRGPRRQFVHSKVMAWVAADRAVRAVDRFGLDGPVDRWRRLCHDIRTEVFERGWDPERRTFTQFYGSTELDASILMAPLVGFLPAADERMQGTVAAIERELCEDGFVHRYTKSDVDGLPGDEGAFLACTFWLADNYALTGRRADALRTFERLLDLRNDLGLLAEEWDVQRGRQLGNYPQAFSHVPLINTARNLSETGGPAEDRCGDGEAGDAPGPQPASDRGG